MAIKKPSDISSLVAMTHEALLAEMPKLDRLNQAERLKHNRRRREKQIKKWKELEEKEFKKNLGRGARKSAASLPIKSDQTASNGVKKIDFIKQSKLFDFVSKRNLKELKAYLDKLSTEDQVTLIGSVNHHGMTALHKCVAEGASKIADELISRGADVNIGDKDQWTPLHAAAFIGDLDLVDLFVAGKADLTQLNLDLQTCLDLTESKEVKEFLQEQFERQKITDEVVKEMKDRPSLSMLAEAENLSVSELNEHRFDNGATLLHIAASNGFTQVVEALIKKGVKLEEADDDGWTPLHAAVYWGHEGTIAKLVMADANFHAETTAGDNVLALAPNENLKERIESMFTDYTKDKAKQFFESIDMDGIRPTRDGRSSSIMAKILKSPDKLSEENITTGIYMGSNFGLIDDQREPEDNETFDLYFKTSVDISDPYLHMVYGESYVPKKLSLASDSLTGSFFSIKQSSRESIFNSKTGGSITPIDEDVLSPRVFSPEENPRVEQSAPKPKIVINAEIGTKSLPATLAPPLPDIGEDSVGETESPPPEKVESKPDKPDSNNLEDSPVEARLPIGATRDLKTHSLEITSPSAIEMRTMSDGQALKQPKRGKAQTTMGARTERNETKIKRPGSGNKNRKGNVVCSIC